MKKVLVITRVSGFVPQHEMNDVRILQDMGYEVHYATNYNIVVYGKDNKRLDGTGIVRHQIDFVESPFSKNVVVACKQLQELIEREEFDFIHCHMTMSAAITRVAAEKVRRKTGRKVPVIYTAHGFYFLKGTKIKNWLYYPIEFFLSKYTDCLVLINEEDYNRAKKFPVRGSVERIFGVGMCLERFEPFKKQTWEIERAKEVENDIRKKYGICEEHKILASVGELATRKNNMIVIRALSVLRDLKLSYLICGDGIMREPLEKEVKRLGLEDRVFFTDYVENVPEILQQCDCFVFPSSREGLPVAVMEAMAVGLPVIASDVRGNSDLFGYSTESGGCLVKGYNHLKYAEKIHSLFAEEKDEVSGVMHREKMGRWNMNRVKSFSADIVEGQMRKIYGRFDKSRA